MRLPHELDVSRLPVVIGERETTRLRDRFAFVGDGLCSSSS